MADAMHPAAPHHLPPFITAPGQTDVFLVGCAIFLIVAVITLGSLYFRLHALPEHLSHGKASKLQFEVVSVMALLALFTHNSWFWVAALLLAIVPMPDLYGPLAGMADLLAKMARWPRRRGSAARMGSRQRREATKAHRQRGEPHARSRGDDRATWRPRRPPSASTPPAGRTASPVGSLPPKPPLPRREEV